MDEAQELFDVIIIGGGPAGISAGVYCARKELKTLLITEDFNNQSVVSGDIQNWVGEPHISGVDLAQKLENHIRDYTDKIQLQEGSKVLSTKSAPCLSDNRTCDFVVATDKGEFKGKSLIICSGARRRRLGVPGENNLEGKGVAFCSICDGPLFKDKTVAVVGGGNAGLEAAHDLFKFVKEIYILEFTNALMGDPMRVTEIKENSKLKEIILNAQVTEVLGADFVSGIKYKDTNSGEEKILEVQGIFVEIGSVPNSEIVKDLVQLDEHKQIMVNFAHCRTSHPGVFAAGDVTNDPYKQNMIAAGDGVRAALACYAYLEGKEKVSPAENIKQ
jgi:NADH-dependent peroxiredoxin subunit F